MPEPIIAIPRNDTGNALRNDDVCIYCGAYTAHLNKQVCNDCDQRLAPNGAKSKENAINRYRHNIIRAAKSMPAKLLDMGAVIKLNEIGLCNRLLDMQDAEHRHHGRQNELMRAIAETEVQLEILKAAHMTSGEDREAYYFHLEQAARREPEQRHNDAYAPLPLL
jgi:hypothetical protein